MERIWQLMDTNPIQNRREFFRSFSEEGRKTGMEMIAEKLLPETTLFDVMINPFIAEAGRRRGERKRTEPEFAKQVNEELNTNRINFLLFGYGQTYEPSAGNSDPKPSNIGSHTIVSYDTNARTFDIISLTHDIRAPEIERALSSIGRKSPPIRIDQAYFVGKELEKAKRGNRFDLMRQTLEDMTGLSIDFQVAFQDGVMKDLVDGVFGKLQVDLPMAFETLPFYLDDKFYPEIGHFKKGENELDGLGVLRLIKTVPKTTEETGFVYDKSIEHNQQKNIFYKA